MYAKIINWELDIISHINFLWDMIYITDEQKDKLEKWCKYINWEIIETEKYLLNINFLDKQNILKKYKDNLQMIKEINSEIQEIEATSSYFPDISNKRLLLLEERRTEFRTNNWLLVQEWIIKFWESIINEL